MRHRKGDLLRRLTLACFGAICFAPAALAQTSSLASCPPRLPPLKIGMVTGGEQYSSHPAETRFGSTHFTRLHQLPLFGADPTEENLDPAYGAAESWTYMPGAKGMIVKIREGLTFNDGTPVTAEDAAFSIDLVKSKFADFQGSGLLNGIGVSAKALDARTLQIDFKQSYATFHIETSAAVFPVYVTSKAYHSKGEITQAAFDAYRSRPLAAGPYRVSSRQTEKMITLVAERRDPLLGCPVYEAIEFREVTETSTRMAQFRTGQFDIISGSRDLLQQAKAAGASVLIKPHANMVGLYFFQTDKPDNIFSDERLRKAAAYAVDSKLIAESIWNNVGVEPYGCSWPPSTEIASANPRFVAACGKPWPFDPEKAKALIKEAGYDAKKGPVVRLEYSGGYPEEPAFAEAMQQMMSAVGFNVTVARVPISERNRRRMSGEHINSILFFGSGGRFTSLAGSGSVYGPEQGWGPKHDQDVVRALETAATAETVEVYMNATADLAELVYNRAYGPAFFDAGSVWFVRKGIADWGLSKSKGRGSLNSAALAARK